MSELVYRERLAAGDPLGLLLLHHGRGADELDLLGLADALDPDRRLHVITPRAPLSLTGWRGWHWYVVARVGHPEPETFHEGFRKLAELHDELWQRTGIEPSKTVLGGFSMGTVMSYALGLSGERPAVAGLLAFSGFLPSVSGWAPHFESRAATRTFIAHGRRDPVIEMSFARRARELVQASGLEVAWHESGVGHEIDPVHLPLARSWLEETLSIRT